MPSEKIAKVNIFLYKIFLNVIFIILCVNSLLSQQDSSVILGCTNPFANNFNSEATQDDGSCTFGLINNNVNNSNDNEPENLYGGCTNPEACNYNKDAVFDDNSCKFLDPCGECDGNGYMDQCNQCDDNPDNDCIQRVW